MPVMKSLYKKPTAIGSQASHTWYRMQRGVVFYGIKNSFLHSQSREYICNVRMVVSPPGIIVMESPADKDGLLLRHLRCEDSNVSVTHVQPRYNRVQYEEPCR